MKLRLCRLYKTDHGSEGICKVDEDIKEYIDLLLISPTFKIDNIDIFANIDGKDCNIESLSSFHEYNEYVKDGNLITTSFIGKYEGRYMRISIHHNSNVLIIDGNKFDVMKMINDLKAI